MMSENMTSPISSSTRSTEQQKSLPTPMADIESSVSRLLQTTKKLLETLTAWSSGQVGDTQVYDEYNALEVHFASATQAFESVLLPMDDMLHLPDDLYACLKDTLSKDPSSTTLEQHLPSIRDTILQLLQGLKKKQSLLRERFEPPPMSSKLLSRAQQQQLSPLRTTPMMPLPSPSSSTEPIKLAVYSVPQSPISPITATSEEFDMTDPSTKDAMNALTKQENLARRSSIRRASNFHILHPDMTTPAIKDTQMMIALYLKKGDRVKKVNVDQSSLNVTKIQQLFHGKFLCTTADAIISILDPESNIEYELEDLSDIKPYSLLSIKDMEENDEMKTLFKDTMHQVLQSIQSNTTPNIPTEKIQEQQEELNSLRHDLANLRQVYDNFKTETDGIIQELRTKSKIQQNTVVMLDPKTRAEMDQSREVTQKAATLITNRLEELQDTIDQIKLDVTQRRCRPSKAQLNHCQQESQLVQTDMNHLSKKLKTFKPIWKKTWEVQLQQIVKEQQFLKEQESLLVDLKDDHKAVAEVLEQLMKIFEIQERKKQSGVALFKVAPVEEGFEGMTSVMKQVSTIHVDHSRRVKALAQAEKSRSKELSQRIDAFERELTDFVGLGKLKKTGGPEAIERQRQEKDKDLIKQIFVDSNANVVQDKNVGAEKEHDHDETKTFTPLEDETVPTPMTLIHEEPGEEEEETPAAKEEGVQPSNHVGQQVKLNNTDDNPSL